MSESPSSLASVIGSSRVHRWGPSKLAKWTANLLDEEHALTKFHKKFWGKSMADEEQEWRDALHKSTARGDATTEQDEITEGCYVLDIGIKGFKSQKIWIRRDYIRMYDYIDAYFVEDLNVQDRPNAVVITGHPGIGKTTFTYYATRRRLAERKPFIFYWQKSCILFVEDGVYEAPQDFISADPEIFIWTFVDSDEAAAGVPEHLFPHGTHLSIIYTTSPRKERWSRLHKSVGRVVLIMNPWTRAEIFQAAQTLSPKYFDRTHIDDAFDQFGPTPRLCIESLTNREAFNDYQWELGDAISTMTIEKLEQLLQDAGSLTMDAMSHKICLLSRKDQHKVHSHPVVTSITPYIQSRLASRFRTLDRAEKIRLYRMFTKNPKLSSSAGFLFELLGQQRLEDGVTLKCLPMVRLQDARSGRPRWYSSHIRLANESLEKLRKSALNQPLVISINPSSADEYSANVPSSITPEVLYIPAHTNQVAFDSFILLDGTLYIFQFTISSQQDIKPGLLDLCKKYPDLPPIKNWCFVFIIPPDLTLVCPQPQGDGMCKLLPQSTVMSFQKFDS